MNVTEAQYQVRVSIANFKDVMAFANRINQMSGCRSLTSDEKLNIIMAYPIILQAS